MRGYLPKTMTDIARDLIIAILAINFIATVYLCIRFLRGSSGSTPDDQEYDRWYKKVQEEGGDK